MRANVSISLTYKYQLKNLGIIDGVHICKQKISRAKNGDDMEELTLKQPLTQQLNLPAEVIPHIEFLLYLKSLGLLNTIINIEDHCIHVLSNSILDYYFNHLLIFSTDTEVIQQAITTDKLLRGSTATCIEVYTNNIMTPVSHITIPEYHLASNLYPYNFAYSAIAGKLKESSYFTYRIATSKKEIHLWTLMQNHHHSYNNNEIKLLTDALYSQPNKIALYNIYHNDQPCGSIAIYDSQKNIRYHCFGVIAANNRKRNATEFMLNLWRKESANYHNAFYSCLTNYKFHNTLQKLGQKPLRLVLYFQKNHNMLEDI